MIKEQFIEVNISANNIKWYREKKYLPIMRKILSVEANDIPLNSKIEIIYICDYCGIEFKRTIGSNNRSKTEFNKKDSCLKCSKNFRHKETCMNKYGVDSPMKDKKIQENFIKSISGDPNKNVGENLRNQNLLFFNGVPASKVQIEISNIFNSFLINKWIGRKCCDLVDIQKKIIIEYNGKGHNLSVVLGKISQEQFNDNETNRTKELLGLGYRLLTIKDNKDLLKRNFNKIPKKEIENFIDSDQIYDELVIK